MISPQVECGTYHIAAEFSTSVPVGSDGQVDSLAGRIGLDSSRADSGEVYVEGVYIKNPDLSHSHYTGDGIDVNDDFGTADVTLENVRIEGIDGCDPVGDQPRMPMCSSRIAWAARCCASTT